MRFPRSGGGIGKRPIPPNFKCRPAPGRTSSVMIMNGRRDPPNPFDGGEVSLSGMLRGAVRSSREWAFLRAAIAAPRATNYMTIIQ
jgi:poly(3-hydroxybutyrate) depolymerase